MRIAHSASLAARTRLADRHPTMNQEEAISLAELTSVAIVNDSEIQRSGLGRKVEALGHSPHYFFDLPN
jgi:hypothetical protein